MKEFDVETYKTRAEIIRQTAQQIKTDFERFGMEITFSGNPDMAYDELMKQVSDHLVFLLENNFQRLKSLLYQIDISERKILEKVNEFPEASESEILADLIIHRELKKVIIRNYYKINKKI